MTEPTREEFRKMVVSCIEMIKQTLEMNNIHLATAQAAMITLVLHYFAKTGVGREEAKKEFSRLVDIYQSFK